MALFFGEIRRRRRGVRPRPWVRREIRERGRRAYGFAQNKVETGNSRLLVFVSDHEEQASVKHCAEFSFSLTAILVAISLTILFPDGLAQTHMVLVTTGSTMPEPLYMLWGDEYHKLHPETQLRYVAV